MGCAGSNPLPADDTMTTAASSNGRATAVDDTPVAETVDRPVSIVQKVVDSVGNVNMDDVVKKIQDVTGSMENLMDGTQEKLGSLFGKIEQKTEDVVEAVEDKANDSTLTMPEKARIHEVIFTTAEETRVPVDEIKSELWTNENFLVDEEVKVMEEKPEIKTENTQSKENEKVEKQEVEEAKEEKKVEEEEEKEGEKAEEKEEGEKTEEEEIKVEKEEEKRVEDEDEIEKIEEKEEGQ